MPNDPQHTGSVSQLNQGKALFTMIMDIMEKSLKDPTVVQELLWSM